MRILLVVHQFPPAHTAGTEVYTMGLARALAARYDVFVYHGGASATEEVTAEGFHVRRVAVSAPSNPYAQFRVTYRNPRVEADFAAFLNRVRPDLIHVQHVQNLSAEIIGIAKRRGLPVVLTLHDYWFLCANGQLVRPTAQVCHGTHWDLECVDCAAARLGQPKLTWIRPAVAVLFLRRDAYLRQVLGATDLCLAPSEFLRQKYIAAGLPAEKVIYLENGTDLGRLRASLRPDDDRLRFGYIGSLAWQKGVHVLIEAFNGLPQGEVELRVYGDPNVFPDYAARLRQSAVHPAVRFMGPVPPDRVGEALAGVDVLVVPSLWFENSPLIIQEAFALKIPVVASDLGALPEKVRHGVNGLTFAPGNPGSLRAALRRLLDEPDLLPSLRAGIGRVKSMDEHVVELEGLYRRMLTAPRASAVANVMGA